MKLKKVSSPIITELHRAPDLGRLLQARRLQLLNKDGDWDKFGVPGFAKKLKIDPTALHRIEKSQRYPAWLTVRRLSYELGLEIAFHSKPGSIKLEAM